MMISHTIQSLNYLTQILLAEEYSKMWQFNLIRKQSKQQCINWTSLLIFNFIC
jgi:hypothetical protein